MTARTISSFVVGVMISLTRIGLSLLTSLTRTELFAVVVFFKQETTQAASDAVGVWTPALIDAVLNVGGTYYLLYQLHATAAQFQRAYPRAAEYLALKRRVDPSNKFRNALLDKYLNTQESRR